MANDCDRLQNTLHQWQRCSQELGFSLKKIMACQSKSRRIFCASVERVEDWKQAVVRFSLTLEQMDRLVLNRKCNVGVPSDVSCRVLLLAAEDCGSCSPFSVAVMLTQATRSTRRALVMLPMLHLSVEQLTMGPLQENRWYNITENIAVRLSVGIPLHIIVSSMESGRGGSPSAFLTSFTDLEGDML